MKTHWIYSDRGSSFGLGGSVAQAPSCLVCRARMIRVLRAPLALPMAPSHLQTSLGSAHLPETPCDWWWCFACHQGQALTQITHPDRHQAKENAADEDIIWIDCEKGSPQSYPAFVAFNPPILHPSACSKCHALMWRVFLCSSTAHPDFVWGDYADIEVSACARGHLAFELQ